MIKRKSDPTLNIPQKSVPATKNKIPAWKKKGLRIVIKGESLSSAILKEREEY